MGDGEAVMDEKVRSVAHGYESSIDYDYPKWRWWHNALAVAIIWGIIVVLSW
jgi:hypothetical protein